MRIIIFALSMIFLMPTFLVAESARNRAWKQDFFDEMTTEENFVQGARQLVSVGVAPELANAIIACRIKESRAIFMALSREVIEKTFLVDPYQSGKILARSADKNCAEIIERVNNQ